MSRSRKEELDEFGWDVEKLNKRVWEIILNYIFQELEERHKIVFKGREEFIERLAEDIPDWELETWPDKILNGTLSLAKDPAGCYLWINSLVKFFLKHIVEVENPTYDDIFDYELDSDLYTENYSKFEESVIEWVKDLKGIKDNAKYRLVVDVRLEKVDQSGGKDDRDSSRRG